MELPIPTYYGDEICRVNGLKYAGNVARAVVKARVQELGLFYDRKFDCAKEQLGHSQHQLKLGYESPHSFVLEVVPAMSRVLDLGCADGCVASALKRLKQCHVVGVDMRPIEVSNLDGFHQHDLNKGLPEIPLHNLDYVLLLDVIDQLAAPETFVHHLREALRLSPDAKIIVSAGNIGFFIARFMLLLGQFNYGRRGTLAIAHTRLFTFASLRRLFEQAGYHVIETRGVPAPFPLALGERKLSRLLVRLNSALIAALCKGLFSYQIFMVVQPHPTLEVLLENAERHTAARTAA